MITITNDLINEIRNKVDIVEIIANYVPLVKRGKNYFGVCPFHDDHSPSMSVSSDKQIYTCFSCGATGNVFTFISEYEHISFTEAVKLIGEKVGYDVKVNNRPSVNNVNYEIYNIALKFYQNNINTPLGKKAITYLDERKIDFELIKKFEIGLALSDKSLTNLLIQKGYKLKNLVDLGLSNDSSNDLFNNRIMFPIHDLNGNIVAFSGRIYNTKDTSKYINTKETEIFKKGHILYNYHRCHEQLKKSDVIIVMEGFMDVIRASSIGVNNCVATMGTAVTLEQANLIKKMSNNVILCFDGDKPGEHATITCAETLEKIGVKAKIIRLEEELDPDEYIIKYGKDRFLRKIEEAMNLLDYRMIIFKNNKNLNDTDDLSNYLDESIKELLKVDDIVKVELTLKKLSNEFDISYDTLYLKYQQLNKKTPNEIKVIANPSPHKEVKLNKYLQAEVRLIYYMLKDGQVISLYEKNVSYLPTTAYRFLANEIAYFYKKYGQINIADFISFLADKPDLKVAMQTIMALNLKDDYQMEEIYDYLKVLKEYSVNLEVARLEDSLKKEIDPNKKALIVKKIMEVKGVLKW